MAAAGGGSTFLLSVTFQHAPLPRSFISSHPILFRWYFHLQYFQEVLPNSILKCTATGGDTDSTTRGRPTFEGRSLRKKARGSKLHTIYSAVKRVPSCCVWCLHQKNNFLISVQYSIQYLDCRLIQQGIGRALRGQRLPSRREKIIRGYIAARKSRLK